MRAVAKSWRQPVIERREKPEMKINVKAISISMWLSVLKISAEMAIEL